MWDQRNLIDLKWIGDGMEIDNDLYVALSKHGLCNVFELTSSIMDVKKGPRPPQESGLDPLQMMVAHPFYFCTICGRKMASSLEKMMCIKKCHPHTLHISCHGQKKCL
jgi:hypothetical protein